MALTNHERVGKALELLAQVLRPFVEKTIAEKMGAERTLPTVNAVFTGRDKPPVGHPFKEFPVDLTVVLDVVIHLNTQNKEFWAPKFHRNEIDFIYELKKLRNAHSHNQPFTLADASRGVETVQRVLSVLNTPTELALVEKITADLLRARLDENNRASRRATTALEGMAKEGLRPWREIITPHADVAAGRFRQAEFAADISQVAAGEGADEYRDPKEFFRRTYLTEGLRQLLVGTIKHLSKNDGDPVVELKTNFGGGKTHSMLAVYHLVGGAAKPTELTGVEALLADASVEVLPKANRAVVVGTVLQVTPVTKPDGTIVRTMWGEIAWQLGGAEGYSIIADSDKSASNPGAALDVLLKRYAPCLIVIDEWVAYARQLVQRSDLAAGTFETHFTFAQALSEAVKRVPKVQLVVSIPASDRGDSGPGGAKATKRPSKGDDIEIGGNAGMLALERLENIIGRVQSSWRPASTEESFEIVRRRLFEPIVDAEKIAAKTATIRAFVEMYAAHRTEFPTEASATDYKAKLEAAYPIHPELFERLYSDWSTLARFQRTRGVLRLMASVVQSLWEDESSHLMVLPSMVPIESTGVQEELVKCLEDNWRPVLERDVDGPQSAALTLDRENPNLGRMSASRRVARTVFMASAPNLTSANRGIEDRRIKLGCAQPGEAIAVFGDALRKLSDRAFHLYVDDAKRYWFSPQPTVTRIAEERAGQLTSDFVHEELLVRLKKDAKASGDFHGVHVFVSSADVPDDRELRLVILGPQSLHRAKLSESAARSEATILLETRGTSPRHHQNMLIVLAPDTQRYAELDSATRQFLAWKSIVDEEQTLNLDAFQRKQATSKRNDASDAIDARIAQTWCHLLVPSKEIAPGSVVSWAEGKLNGELPLAEQASKRLKHEGQLLTQWVGTELRRKLMSVAHWFPQREHIAVKELEDAFAKYLYLPRLKNTQLLHEAVRSAVKDLAWVTDGFAYADAWDEQAQRYLGLRAGAYVAVVASQGLVVRADVAERQLRRDAEEAAARAPIAGGDTSLPYIAGGGEASQRAAEKSVGTQNASSAHRERVVRRFHGAIDVDPIRMGSAAGEVGKEVVAFLAAIPGAKVTVSIEISAETSGAFSSDVQRTVSENCRTLKFKQSEFEED